VKYCVEDTWWQEFSLGSIGSYEYEVVVTRNGGPHYTGWHRCKNGRMADGRHPEWYSKTGETRYR